MTSTSTGKKKSGTAVFRPRARIMKLIGSELIGDEVVAVTELVKNAHDADAKTVSISFEEATYDDGEIIVLDDGEGMDLDDLLQKWMEPASAWKAGKNVRRTRLGRRMLGAKGVGRFATDKLGSHLELISRKRGSREEIRAEFDWDLYSGDDRLLSEIRNRWEVRKATTIKSHGTFLRISGLRTNWTERLFRRVSTRLTRLVSPLEGLGDFAVNMVSDEFPEYSDCLHPEFLNKAPYHIDARLVDGLTVETRLGTEKPASHRWNGDGELTCGPVRVRLYAFDLETEAMARLGPRMEARSWIRQWAGVSIYRDGFRVWPYGEPDDDWLRLDQRRVNNPTVRLSNNQVIGFVEISTDGNPDLVDKTNREGIVHGRALDDLRRLMSFVFQILEAERQRIRRPVVRRRGSPSSTDPDGGDPIAVSLEKLAGASTGGLKSELLTLASKTRERSRTEASNRDRLLQGYTELAALGQAAAGMQETVEPLVEGLAESLKILRRELKGSAAGKSMVLSGLKSNLDQLADRLAILSPIASGGTSRRRRSIDVPAELQVFHKAVTPVLRRQGVRMEVETPEQGVVRASMQPQTLMRVLHVLLSNALEWRARKDPRIRLRCESAEDHCEILFSDNGPGIATNMVDRVFDPLFSGRENGQGMGLCIARNIVETHGGTIEVLSDRRRKGANLLVRLPAKRSRATIRQ